MLLILYLLTVVIAQEDPVAPVLRTIINRQTTASYHFVLILREMEVLKTLLPDQPNHIINDKIPIRIEQTRGLIIFSGTSTLSDILTMTQWTSQTRFLLVQPNDNSTDKFTADFKYQDCTNRSLIVTREELFRNFRDILLPDTQNSSSIWVNTKEILQEFWSRRIQHAVVIIPKQTNIYFYANFPFSERRCQEDIKPTLINVWSTTNQTFFKPPNFFPEKLTNLFRCPLNVCVTEVPPGLMLKDRTVLDGIEGKLILEILQKLNATSLIITKQDPKWFGNFSAMDNLFREITVGSSDIGAGLLLPTFQERPTDTVNFCTTVCLAWAVPNHLVPRSAFLVMADVFEPTVWYCIGYSIIVAMVVSGILAQFHGRSYNDIFKILSITFGQTTLIPRQICLKILLINFTWFVIGFSMVYQAGFGSNRIVLRPVHQLKTPEDVLESRIELAGSFTAKRIFEQQQNENEEKIDIRAMDTQNGLIKVAYEQKTAFLGIRLTSKYFTRVVKPDLRNLVYLQNECLIQYHPALAFKHSSPYTDLAKVTVQLLVEAGIVDHEMKMYMSRVNFRSTNSQRRRVRRDPPPSIVVALTSIIRYGLGLSLFVFLVEHVLYYIGKRRQGLWVHH